MLLTSFKTADKDIKNLTKAQLRTLETRPMEKPLLRATDYLFRVTATNNSFSTQF